MIVKEGNKGKKTPSSREKKFVRAARKEHELRENWEKNGGRGREARGKSIYHEGFGGGRSRRGIPMEIKKGRRGIVESEKQSRGMAVPHS